MNKLFLWSGVVTLFAMGAIVFLVRSVAPSASADIAGAPTNVVMAEGIQTIRINAKGGYAPRTTKAQANTPTVLNVVTNGTYDCSLALSIPAVGFRQNLPASGTTPITLPPQVPGTTIKGVCSMGMYSFSVTFT